MLVEEALLQERHRLRVMMNNFAVLKEKHLLLEKIRSYCRSIIDQRPQILLTYVAGLDEYHHRQHVRLAYVAVL